MEALRLSGLIAAPHTAMSADGAIAPEQIRKQVAALLAQGVSGVFVCGTTGEGYALTGRERRELAEQWIGEVAGRVPVIVHVGHASVWEAAELAAHAVQSGADAVAACPPSFVNPGDAEEALGSCAPVAEACAAVRFYYYHIPSLSGVRMDVARFIELARSEIENFGGVKFTEPDLFAFQRALASAGEEYDVLWGVDEMLLGALAVGATGAVGSTYNYMAGVYVEMMSAFGAGDVGRARLLAQRSVRVVEELGRWGGIRCGKALMELHGFDAGPVRPPLVPLERQERDEILAAVRGILA